MTSDCGSPVLDDQKFHLEWINMILAELRHIEDYDDIYGKSKTYDIETFKIDGEGYFFGKFWWRVF